MRWTWWAVAAAAALLSTSQWLHAPSVEYLVALIVATVATLATTPLVPRIQRRWTVACSLLLAIGAVLAIAAQRNLWVVQHDWESWRRNAADAGLDALHREIDRAAAGASTVATRAARVSADRARAFGELPAIVRGGPDERGVVVYRGDSAFAWAGMIRPRPDPTHDGTTLIATPFYLALQIAHRSGGTTAAAIVLLDAAPPADRLSSPLAKRVATEAGLSGFVFGPPVDTSRATEILRYSTGGVRLFDVRAAPIAQGEAAQNIIEAVRARAGLAFSLALICFVIGVWRGTRTLSQRVAALAVGLACTALVPLNEYSNVTRAFDPAVYFSPRGGPLTANAGALAITSALVLLGILAVSRRQSRRISTWGAAITVMLAAGLGPFLLRDLARGVKIPPNGVDATLWLIWEIPLFLAAVSVILAGAAAGSSVLGPRRGLSPWVAPALAAVAAVLAQVVWQAPGRWPGWYTILWIAAIGLLGLSRRTRYVILSASTVAALGATTLVWGRTARGRVDAAERDLAGLSQPDSVALTLLRRFGMSLTVDSAPASRQALLQRYVISDVAAAGNPIALFAWPTDTGSEAAFKTADIPIPSDTIARLVTRARQSGTLMVETVPTDSSIELVMAAPSPTGGVTAAVLAPKSRLFATDPYADLLGLEGNTDIEPPYTVRLREAPASTTAPLDTTVRWRREGSQLHGDWMVRTGTGVAPAHVEVELRTLDALIERGTLIVLLNLAIVGLLWLASVVADGGAGRWIRARRRTLGRTYRTRLSFALLAFFVIPAIAFAVWSYDQLATDATQSRRLLVGETLRAVVSPPRTSLWLPAESDRLDTPLFLYRGGELTETSDVLYDDLAPTGRYLLPPTAVNLAVRGEEIDTQLQRVGPRNALFGYRAFAGPSITSTVVGAPARADDLPLGRRRRDLGVLVAFATVVGALAALWLSGIAARQLARPIGTLREAALAIAGGSRMPPLEIEPTVEFHPVFAAFRRMDADLIASRTALEDAQRRTAAVLRNVASGVIAVDREGQVTLANPRAEGLFGMPIPPGTPASHLPPAIGPLVERFLASSADDEDFEVTLDQQQLRGTLTRLRRGGGGGGVLTVDDVTELARAQRVLAWGEMARQVAHEIKNPLTPIRLGVQHLRRARADARVDFDRVLEHNVKQILAEIDRLDEIARAFSRYGAAPEERRRAALIDVAGVVREVVSLERMGADGDVEGDGEATAGPSGNGVVWTELGVDAPIHALARGDELKEVLLNVLENARHAQAKRVTVSVGLTDGNNGDRCAVIAIRDDGHGIPAAVLPRIFEPHFSTRTSGSGLGLAISRQLVEGWGGEITVESTEGAGTTVEISLRAG